LVTKGNKKKKNRSGNRSRREIHQEVKKPYLRGVKSLCRKAREVSGERGGRSLDLRPRYRKWGGGRKTWGKKKRLNMGDAQCISYSTSKVVTIQGPMFSCDERKKTEKKVGTKCLLEKHRARTSKTGISEGQTDRWGNTNVVSGGAGTKDLGIQRKKRVPCALEGLFTKKGPISRDSGSEGREKYRKKSKEGLGKKMDPENWGWEKVVAQ